MLKYFYQWRYNRSQRAGAFKLPDQRREGKYFRVDFANYLSQDSVRGRNFDRFDLPRGRARWLRLLAGLLGLLFFGWVVYESIMALSTFRD